MFLLSVFRVRVCVCFSITGLLCFFVCVCVFVFVVVVCLLRDCLLLLCIMCCFRCLSLFCFVKHVLSSSSEHHKNKFGMYLAHNGNGKISVSFARVLLFS